MFSCSDAIMSRKQIVLDDNQRSVLEKSFANNALLTKVMVKNLSQLLGLCEKTICNWFLNKRRRSKKGLFELPSSKHINLLYTKACQYG